MSGGYDRKTVFAAACLGMLVFGVVLTTLGSILPSLMERFGMDKAEAGSLFFLLTLGILVASLGFGPIADRYGYRSLLIGATALILAGMQGIAFATSPLGLRAAILAIGVGGGVVNGGTAALTADISEGRRSAAISLQGVFFGIGAVGVPFSMGLLLDTFSYSALISAAGLTTIPLLLVVALIRFPAPKQAQGLPLRAIPRLLADPALVLLGLMLFLQSGMEITVGGWTAAYFEEELRLAGDSALLFLSLYWFGMMLSRLALGTFLAGVPPARALRTCIAIAFAGALLLFASTAPAAAGAGVFLLGAGFGAGFPVILGYVGDRYAAVSGTAFSLVLTMALSGGMTLPFVTGVLGESYGLRSSFLIVPAALVLSFILFAVMLRSAARRPAATLAPQP